MYQLLDVNIGDVWGSFLTWRAVTLSVEFFLMGGLYR
jgi:hypothetical protein